MKPLEQLGISHAPWRVDVDENNAVTCNYRREDGTPSTRIVTVCNPWFAENQADCRLIAAAPDLYKALREAVVESCHVCPCFRDADDTCGNDKPCFVKDWRAVIEKAGGEE